MTELCLNERSLHELAWAPAAAARPASPGLGAAALAAVLDELDHGVLVVDAQGLVLQQNDAARRELAGAQLLRQGTEGRLEMAGSEGWLLGRAVSGLATAFAMGFVAARARCLAAERTFGARTCGH